MSYSNMFLSVVLPLFQGRQSGRYGRAEIWQGGAVRLGVQKIVERLMFLGLTMPIFIACSSESAPDCFQASGDMIREEVTVSNFTKITVFENVGLVLKEGPEIKVEVETGENLRNEVLVTVEEGRLILRNTNDCNYVRDYGLTKIFVTAPDITEIRSSTGLKVESDGILAYPRLNLVSESFNNPESETTDGVFDLEVDGTNFTIVVNGIAYFKLKGKTEFLGVTIAAGDSRVEAQNLRAKFIDLNHRGSNDILCNPQDLIKGEIKGTGDVISFNRPDLIQVKELFKGKLIFKD